MNTEDITLLNTRIDALQAIDDPNDDAEVNRLSYQLLQAVPAKCYSRGTYEITYIYKYKNINFIVKEVIKNLIPNGKFYIINIYLPNDYKNSLLKPGSIIINIEFELTDFQIYISHLANYTINSRHLLIDEEKNLFSNFIMNFLKIYFKDLSLLEQFDLNTKLVLNVIDKDKSIIPYYQKNRFQITKIDEEGSTWMLSILKDFLN